MMGLFSTLRLRGVVTQGRVAMRTLAVLAGALFVAGCSQRQSDTAPAGYCGVGSNRVAADPVTGCGRPPLSTPEPPSCPMPVAIHDAQHHLQPGITIAHQISGRRFPDYPAAYQDKGLRGKVAADCVISVDGRLCGCHLQAGDAPEYFGASLMLWLRGADLRYQPATKNGVPMASTRTFTVTFEPMARPK